MGGLELSLGMRTRLDVVHTLSEVSDLSWAPEILLAVLHLPVGDKGKCHTYPTFASIVFRIDGEQ